MPSSTQKAMERGPPPFGNYMLSILDVTQIYRKFQKLAALTHSQAMLPINPISSCSGNSFGNVRVKVTLLLNKPGWSNGQHLDLKVAGSNPATADQLPHFSTTLLEE